MTLQNRVLAFRLISRAACSMHHLLRSARNHHPYLLFLALLNQKYGDDSGPACLWDELTVQFRTWYPEFTNEACAALEALAEAIDLDIAAIESRHAVSRRLVMTKGVQAWVPSVQSVSADFSYGQVRRNETSKGVKMTDPAQSDEACDTMPNQNQRLCSAASVPNRKKRRGGGGSWRAFVHLNLHGDKLTSAKATQLSEQYRALSDEEMAPYITLGEQGTLAARYGSGAFGERRRQRPEQQPTAVPDFHDDLLTLPHADMQLVSFSSRDFKKDMVKIRKRFSGLTKAVEKTGNPYRRRARGPLPATFNRIACHFP